MKVYEPGDVVIFSSIALAGYDIRMEWINEETVGMIVKRFDFGEDLLEKDLFNNKPNIQFPKFVYTLLSLGEVVEVLDIDIVRKI